MKKEINILKTAQPCSKFFTNYLCGPIWLLLNYGYFGAFYSVRKQSGSSSKLLGKWISFTFSLVCILWIYLHTEPGGLGSLLPALSVSTSTGKRATGVDLQRTVAGAEDQYPHCTHFQCNLIWTRSGVVPVDWILCCNCNPVSVHSQGCILRVLHPPGCLSQCELKLRNGENSER